MPPVKLNPCSTGVLQGVGNTMPRLERNTPANGFSASRGPGRFSTMTAYQKNSCTISGMLRITSM